MKLTYFLKNKSLYFRFRNGRHLSVIRKLPFNIQPEDWSAARCATKKKELHPINVQLVKFKAFLMNEYNIALSNDVNIDLGWIKQKQYAFFNTTETDKTHKIYLKKYLEFYIREENPVSTNFNILKNHIPVSTRIIDVDINWMERFSKNKLKVYAESTVGKHLQQIKMLLKHAERNGININRSALDYRIKGYRTINTYLNEEEINRLFAFNFHTEYLNNAKRLFLVGCTTGLRVSDLMRIKEFRIVDDFLELVTKKTRQPVIIPLDPRVRHYMPLLRPISHQKFNQYIKKMCQIAGIDQLTDGYIRNNENKRVRGTYPKYKLITSHSMRRSFASNLYGKLPNATIMAITGHKTEKSFLTYIKKPQRDFAEQLKRYYESR